jgi:polyisoprenoid-binding protein YceI
LNAAPDRTRIGPTSDDDAPRVDSTAWPGIARLARKDPPLKRTLSIAVVALGLLGVTSLSLAEPRTFSIDRSHSEVGFDIRHFFNKVHGRFNDYTGKIVFDDKDLAASSVEVTIRDTSIYTGNDRRDSDLRGESFFWTEKYPLVTFKSTKVVPGADASHFKIEGDLTMRDVTKPVTLDVEFLGSGALAIEGHSVGTQAGWVATTRINRKEWGILWNKSVDQGGVMLDENVDLTLNIAGFIRDAAPAAPAAPKGGAAPTTK